VTAALLFMAVAAVAFIFWMALGSRWLIWMFVLVTLVLAIDATHPGVANTPILLPILAQNQVGG
jgi:hypothetical protein